jgi:hypothetical protein
MPVASDTDGLAAAVAPSSDSADGDRPINELFCSLQGEGQLSGVPSVCRDERDKLPGRAYQSGECEPQARIEHAHLRARPASLHR